MGVECSHSTNHVLVGYLVLWVLFSYGSNQIRTRYPYIRSAEWEQTTHLGYYLDQETPDESWKAQRLKCCVDDYKDEDLLLIDSWDL